MTNLEDIDRVNPDDVSLTEGPMGYTILVDGQRVGAIEGLPGQLEHISVELHLEGKGIGRAALNEFIELSRFCGASEVTTNNATHPAMEHILETEGFEEKDDGIGWVKDIS